MKTFLVVFKNGQKVHIKAHSFNVTSNGYVTFWKDANHEDSDIHVASMEVLYVVPAESTDDDDSE